MTIASSTPIPSPALPQCADAIGQPSPRSRPRRRAKSNAGASPPRGDQAHADSQQAGVPAQTLAGESSRAGHLEGDTHGRTAGVKSRPASEAALSMGEPQDAGDGQPQTDRHSSLAVAHTLDRANGDATPRVMTRGPGSGGGHCTTDAPASSTSPAPIILALWRQRQDLRRAEQRLDLQCQALCRSACNADKDEAAKLWSAIKKGEAEAGELALIFAPFRAAMAQLDEPATRYEKQLEKLAQTHPLWTAWGKGVRGLGPLSFAGMVAEARDPIGAYRGPAALWKRFGLAVIDGERQRKKADADAALAHGYSPPRRAFMYVVSTNLLRAQREGDPYRAIYVARKAQGLEKPDWTLLHAHNHALRLMAKALLKDAWRAARAAEV